MRRSGWPTALLALALFATPAVLGSTVPATAAPEPAAATASPGTQYKVTFVARVCQTYGDIMANLARNNIQESLRDLGKNTVYKSGQPVSPKIEAPNNPACTPLAGWQFALGTGYTSKTPSTDYLSTVTGDYGQTIAVQPTTPELDAQGRPTGKTLQDAVTVTLTADQAQRAQQGNKLWTQGGTKAEPLMNNLFPGEYGFGALRCAIDNLNGDNVEWIGYPSGSTHVFCYYYAVKPPPSAGTIVVRKSLETGSNGPATFRYVGNISYTTTNDFTLTPASDTSPASTSFVRAAGDSWDFEEQPTAGYTFVSLECQQTTPPIEGPASSWTITGRKAVVKVGDGATVACNYVNRTTPPVTGHLELTKITYGGVGSFPFRITDPLGSVTTATATTTAEGREKVVASADTGATGTWTTRETLPADTEAGGWKATSVQCNGDTVPFTTSDGPSGATYVTAERTITENETVACAFANTFVPDGQILIDKRTSAGTGTFAFPVVRQDQADSGAAFAFYEATTTTPGVVTAAHPASGYPALSHLAVGEGTASTYEISELSPPNTTTAYWQLTAVTCTGVSDDLPVAADVNLTTGTVTVELTAAEPRVRCLFDNERVEQGSVATDGAVLLTKQITGRLAGDQGGVHFALTCANGASGSWQVPAGQTGTVGMSAPFIVPEAASCTVTETQNGSSASVPLTVTSWTVDAGAKSNGSSVSFQTVADHTTQVAVIDEYGDLAPSGATTASTYALLGLLLVGLGSVLFGAGRARRDN
jgi:hypothetical protein